MLTLGDVVLGFHSTKRHEMARYSFIHIIESFIINSLLHNRDLEFSMLVQFRSQTIQH